MQFWPGVGSTARPAPSAHTAGPALERTATSISGSLAARALAGGTERLDHMSSRIILHLRRLSVAVLAEGGWVDSVPFATRQSPVRSHRLRSVRHATRRSGVAGRCRAIRWRTRVASASTTRATPSPRSRPRTPTRRRTAVPAQSHRLQSVRNATCRPGGAGRCRAAVLGHRVWWRPSAKGEQQLHRLHACLELRRHPWHSGSSRLEPTSSRCDPPPSMKPVCHRDGAAASPTGARTARRRQSPEPPPASACCWYV